MNYLRKPLLFLTVFLSLLSACSRPPLIIGYAGQLTGIQSDSGIQGRNGAIMAVETINESGGIGGRAIELIIRDDGTSPEEAVNADAELVESGAIAIIGHITSTKTLAAVPYLSRLNIPLVSPTASSSELEGVYTLLFRMNSDSQRDASAAASWLFESADVSDIILVLDRDNPVLSESFSGRLSEDFTGMGGSVSDTILFSSRENPSWEDTASRILERQPEGLVVVASAFDTAALASALYKKSGSGRETAMPVILSNGWANNSLLLRLGGKAVEGMIFADSFNETYQENERYVRFSESYLARFGLRPSFAAVQSYDSVMFIAEGLRRSGGDPEKLPAALGEIRSFEGACETVALDDSGEALRPVFITAVSQGAYVLLEKRPHSNYKGSAR